MTKIPLEPTKMIEMTLKSKKRLKWPYNQKVIEIPSEPKKTTLMHLKPKKWPKYP